MTVGSTCRAGSKGAANNDEHSDRTGSARQAGPATRDIRVRASLSASERSDAARGIDPRDVSLVRDLLGRLAARFPRGIDLDNLEAAGVLGLVEAANRFEVERGIAFKTFAYTRIRGAIYDELRRNCPLPQDLLERTAKVRKILQSLPPPASIERLASESGLTEEDVTECLAAMRLTRNVSWDDIAPFNKGQLASNGEPR